MPDGNPQSFGEVAQGKAQPSLALQNHIDQLLQYQVNGAALKTLTKEARRVYLLSMFIGEMNNGGFDQFFFNSLGDLAPEILIELEAIGAMNSHRLLTQAMQIFGDTPYPRDRLLRQDKFLAFTDMPGNSEKLHELDKIFYRWEDDIDSRLDTFVTENPKLKIWSD